MYRYKLGLDYEIKMNKEDNNVYVQKINEQMILLEE